MGITVYYIFSIFCYIFNEILRLITNLLFSSYVGGSAKLDDVELPHFYGISIHSKAEIGNNVTIRQLTTIGGK